MMRASTYTLPLLLAAATTVLLATAVLAESLDSEQYGIQEFDEDVEDTSKWASRSLLNADNDGDDDDESLIRRSPPPPRRSPSPPPPRRSPPPPYYYRSPPRTPRTPPPPPPWPPRVSTCRANRTLCLQPGSVGPDCCNGICTNVLTDERNCGFCNIPCLFGTTCCGRSGCVDTRSNNRHCGMCNNVCPPVRGSRIPGRCRGGLCEYSG